MLNIALFGAPGAGKGTQSKFLIEKYKLTYIATGDLLREEMAEKTELGLMVKSTIEKGMLVSEEIIVQIIENKIKNNSNTSGFLFDGFPRNLKQAKILEDILIKMNTQLNGMICLDVPDDILIERMLKRAETSKRIDDTEEVIKFRLKEYYDKTFPVAEYFKNKKNYYSIDGLGSIHEISERIEKVIKEIIAT